MSQNEFKQHGANTLNGILLFTLCLIVFVFIIGQGWAALGVLFGFLLGWIGCSLWFQSFTGVTGAELKAFYEAQTNRHDSEILH